VVDDLPELVHLVRRPSWMHDALCREPGYAALNWHPRPRESAAPAIEVCQRCLVRDECLAFALDNDAHLPVGVYGGLSGKQRRRLRSQRAAARRERDDRGAVVVVLRPGRPTPT